jgi:hypothetical protein
MLGSSCVRQVLVVVAVMAAALAGACGTGEDGGGGGGVDAMPGGAGSDASAGGGGEPSALAGITAAHNEVRATVDVPPLTWDAELAAVAQAWADQCQSSDGRILDHNAGRSDSYPGYVGENIYASSGTARPGDAVDAWAGEAADYDHDTNTCSGVCGHYTQLVWADTERVGCGIADCGGIRFPSTIVCDYSPGGNINGEPPY